MPQSKRMKTQWVDIDGRPTPFVLPQTWNEELDDWEVTGTNNPLPTRVINQIELPIDYPDTAVKAELESIKQQQTEILERLDNLPQGFIKESTAPRPSGKENDSLLLWDTRQVYVHDGSDWREL